MVVKVGGNYQFHLNKAVFDKKYIINIMQTYHTFCVKETQENFKHCAALLRIMDQPLPVVEGCSHFHEDLFFVCAVLQWRYGLTTLVSLQLLILHHFPLQLWSAALCALGGPSPDSTVTARSETSLCVFQFQCNVALFAFCIKEMLLS